VQLLGRLGGVAPSFLQQVLEAREIELLGLDLQHVARGSAARQLSAESLPQPRDVHLHRLCRPSGRLHPERIDQPLCGDDLVRVQKEDGQHRPLPRPSERERTPVAAGLERTEDPKVHSLRRRADASTVLANCCRPVAVCQPGRGLVVKRIAKGGPEREGGSMERSLRILAVAFMGVTAGVLALSVAASARGLDLARHVSELTCHAPSLRSARAARKVAGHFAWAVLRKHPLRARTLVTPALTAGTTRRDWRRGFIPVVPFIARGRIRVSLRSTSSAAAAWCSALSCSPSMRAANQSSSGWTRCGTATAG